MPRGFAGVMVLTLALGGCNSTGGANATDDALSANAPVDPRVDKLLADAGYGSAQVKEVSRVVWRNTSLGCPEKGMVYAQMLVDGYLIVADVDGTATRLHASDNGRVIACPAERARPPLEQVKD